MKFKDKNKDKNENENKNKDINNRVSVAPLQNMLIIEQQVQ